MKQLHEKSIGNKTNSDNTILMKSFSGARTNTIKHYASPDLETKPDLVILCVLAPTTLNFLVYLKRSPIKLFHNLYLEKKMAIRLQFHGIFS